MRDLGREKTRLHNLKEQPGAVRAEFPSALNPWAFIHESPAATGCTGLEGNSGLGTHLSFAESFNLFLSAVLPSPQSDAGTDLFSHPRILHTNHLVGTDGLCDPWGRPWPPTGSVCWPMACYLTLYHRVLEHCGCNTVLPLLPKKWGKRFHK